MENFLLFQNSEHYSLLQDKIELDISERKKELIKNLQNIEIEKDIKHPLLIKIITPSVNERKFEGDLRIATRLVLDAIFKHCLI